MIVAKGLGRRASGATGIIVASGLGLVLVPALVGGGGVGWRPSTTTVQTQAVRKLLDDRDLLELVPIIVEVLNARR